MIIIPTEKRFDWQHAPYVLFSIVALNIIIFFFYQSGDHAKYALAFQQYQEQHYLDIEWPLFEEFLTERKELNTLEDKRRLYQQERYDELVSYIVLRLDFYQYMRVERYNYFRTADVGEWFFKRALIYDAVRSTSIASWGLVPPDLTPVTLLSYQFLHGNLVHLLGNLFLLIICGFAVEAAIGRWRFLGLYLISGMVGGLLHALVNLKEGIPLVGASGAISGTMAMYLGLFRAKKIEFFYWIFIFVGYFRAPAVFILAFYIVKELFQLLAGADSNIAFMAHIGGFIAGGVSIAIAYKFAPTIFNQAYIDEDQSTDTNREQLATIYNFIAKYQFDAADKALKRLLEAEEMNADIAELCYNVGKITKGDYYKKAMIRLLLPESPDGRQLLKAHQTWCDNQKMLLQLKSENLLKIALLFLQLPNPKTSSNICDYLVKQNYRSTSLSDLAEKLSVKFLQRNDSKAHKKYLHLSNQLRDGKPTLDSSFGRL